jgi:hypothetical protein
MSVTPTLSPFHKIDAPVIQGTNEMKETARITKKLSRFCDGGLRRIMDPFSE